MSEPIPLAKPELGAREEELVLEVLRSGRLSLGPTGERFERAFAEWLGVEDAVAVSSGTTGLHLGVRALGWGPGDEVLTSPFSFVASANCLLYEGVRPVFCDVDPVTLNLDPEAAAAAVGERTAGILPVHIFGYPAAMPELEALGAKHDLGLLEDACEALGAVDSEGRNVGSRGHLATFAFYANKQMTTGEGGMVVPADAAAADRLRSERNQGRAADMGWLDHGGLGFNYRLSDVAAALGVAQVERLGAMLAERSRVAALYADGLAALEGVETPIAGRGSERRSWFVYPVRLAAEIDRDRTIARLAEREVASKAYLPCIHLFPQLRELGYGEGQFPVAEAASAHSLALPFFPAMSESQVARVCEALAESIR
ncbi:MAG TPA: DegT/DnrJ/EryC1/StrS family aminotransferase [Solirubrobacterales bacterium]|jgi:perosamine synthetase|nr:DegT/DnrJ/EryC1/StrS family aminotransferase [Solirubrobacterales bacterium]